MRKALVAVCHNGPVVFTKTAQSLVEFGWGDRIPYCRDRLGFASIGFRWFGAAPRVDMLRNKAVRFALDEGFTHLVFLDADMVWPSTAIYDLLQHHDCGGIVAGLYTLKGPPYSPVHLVDQFEEHGVNKFLRATDYPRDALFEVDVVGMGCTLIPTDVFRQVGESNWFDYAPDEHGWPVVSEDVTLCLKAKALGIPRYVDPRIQCGHVGVQVFDERWHHRYQASIEASKDMGPTVTIHGHDNAQSDYRPIPERV